MSQAILSQNNQKQKNLNKNKHFLFYEIIQKLNSTRNFYFIKTLKKSLNRNVHKLVENSSVKIVQSNFPDSIFLPLVVSLYGEKVPKLILFIEGEELMDNSKNNLIKWINNAYKKIMRNNIYVDRTPSSIEKIISYPISKIEESTKEINNQNNSYQHINLWSLNENN